MYFPNMRETVQINRRSVARLTFPYLLLVLTPPPQPPSPWLFGDMKCPDIENNDEGAVQIGTETFTGLNTDLCDRS